MISDDAAVHATPRSFVDYDEDEVDVSRSVFHRPNGFILEIYLEEGRRFVEADLSVIRETSKTHWPDFLETGELQGIITLSSDLEPISTPVREVSAPPALTAELKLQISKKAAEDCEVTLRRIPGIVKCSRGYHLKFGGFAVGSIGGSRVVVIPVIVDHTKSQGFDEFRTFDYALVEALSAGEAIAQAVEQKVSGGVYSLFRPHIIFGLYDPLGYVREWLHYDLRLKGDGLVDPTEIDLHHVSRAASYRVCLLGETDPIFLNASPTTVRHALEFDSDYCQPRNIKGRWRQIEDMFSQLGLLPLFEYLHKVLKEKDWNVVQDTYELSHHYEVRYLPRDESGPAISLIKGLSSLGTGLCVVHYCSEENSLSECLHQLKTEQDVVTLIERLAPTRQ
jgi:hypothetical protein